MIGRSISPPCIHVEHIMSSFDARSLEHAIATPTNDFAFLDSQKRLHVIFTTIRTPGIAIIGVEKRTAGKAVAISCKYVGHETN